jgi:glycosyltransferase involved in cell wall biosynthesis
MPSERGKFPSMAVTFVLAGASRVPAGGHRVIFEYANHLTYRGHNVSVVHAAQADPLASTAKKAYAAAGFQLRSATNDFGPQSWFRLWPTIKLLWVPSVDEQHIPPADVIVATNWATAEAVASYAKDKGHKFYLLQKDESSSAPEERVRATWKLPLQKIVVARWLKELAAEMGESAAYIPNGMDFDAFGCDIPVRERTRPTVSMWYDPFVWKGAEDGIKALRMAQRALPGLQATLFGTSPAPKGLPNGIKYLRQPPQTELRQIYNQSAAFLAPSWKEGWPLAPAEAMTCGAALVCTDIPGHNEYAVHERNSFMAKPQDPQSLAEALIRMLREKTLRFRLAEQALSDIHRFTWEEAADRVETEFGWRVAGRIITYSSES